MKDDAIIPQQEAYLARPDVPKDWDYDKSVKRVGGLVYKWKNITIEIAGELSISRDALSSTWEAQERSTDGTFVPPDKTWVGYCEEVGIEKRSANRWIERFFGPSRLPSPVLPKLESQVIYADPPWAFSNSGFDQSAAQIYSTMPTDEICKYADKTGKTIQKLASEKRSVLFLWVPASLIPDGLDVVKAWGFSYKTQMIWAKDKSPGMGWWVKTKHEVLFIASKGEKLHPAIKYDSLFEAPARKHSQKPEKVYTMIEAMYTGPYIELFARNKREGWEGWGNEF